jgi:hypothetical protein
MISSWPGECKMIFNRPRHPQSNGLVEQANGTIENHIAAAMEQFKTKQWTKLLPLIIYNLNTSMPYSTKIMPFKVVFNKLPNLGSKKQFVEINKDGNEESVGAEEEAPIAEEVPAVVEVPTVEQAPTTSSDPPSTSSPSSNVDEEEAEEEEDDEEINNLRNELNKNMDKNALMMIKKHDHKRNKKTREFNVKDNVSVSIPRIDRGGTDLRRLPGKIVKVSTGVNRFYTVLTVWGILNDKYRGTSLEPFSGIIDVEVEDEQGNSIYENKYKTISLTEAAKLQNAGTGSLEVVNVICNCGTVCYGDGRCKCYKAKQLCTSHCHGKMKGKPMCCKNHDKRGGIGKKAEYS